jgi:hypothetical protein
MAEDQVKASILEYKQKKIKSCWNHINLSLLKGKYSGGE